MKVYTYKFEAADSCNGYEQRWWLYLDGEFVECFVEFTQLMDKLLADNNIQLDEA